MKDKLKFAFFSYGWLIPAWLPLAQSMGRALFNIFAILYFLWAVASFYGRSISIERPVILLYVAMLIAFCISMPLAHDSLRAVETWLNFLIHSMAFFFTFAALQSVEIGVTKLLRALALCGLSLVAYLYMELPWLLEESRFRPQYTMTEDNLPLLLPFILFSIVSAKDNGWWKITVIVAIFALLGYVTVSQGRAALLASIIGLFIYFWLVMRLRAWWTFTLIVLVLFTAISFSSDRFWRGTTFDKDWQHIIDRFSAHRTNLWRQAFDNPPSPLGVGMGNSRYAGLRAKHLHNFILDSWYETGLPGAVLLLGFIGYVSYKSLRCWKKLSKTVRGHAGIFVAASAAILTSASLSYSYTSEQFSMYLFVFLAALAHLSGRFSTVQSDDKNVPLRNNA